jgi:hypothetical protein
MAILRTMQPSFTAGELSPALWARVDLSKYASGLKTAKNVFIHPHGGASNRAGLQFVAETRGSGKARQIPFIFDAETDQTYDLVFTNLNLRIYRAGSPILNADKAITGVTQASPGVVTSAAHGYSNGQEIVITGIVGMTELNGRNFIVAGATTNTFTLKDMYGVAVDTNGFTAYASGGTANSLYEIASPYDEDDLPLLVFAQEKDVMYITHTSYAPRKLSRLADDDWTLTTPTFAPAMSAPTGLTGTARYKFRRGDSDTGMSFKVTAVDASGNESAASSATTPLDWQYQYYDGRFVRVSWNAVSGASLYRVYKVDSSPGIVSETPDTSADMPTGPGPFAGDGTTAPTVADTGAPSTPTGVTAEIVFGEEDKYAVSAVSEDTGEESLPSSSFTLNNDMTIDGNKNTLSWDAVTGASKYYVYRFDNGLWGFIGESTTTIFTDENITPDTSQGPQEGNNPFNATGDYPRCVTFYEQRLAFGGSINEPSAIWLGQTANYENFGSASPATDADAIIFRIRSREKNEIRGLVPVRGLGAFSSVAEWMITGSNGDFLGQNPVIKPQSYRGMSYVQPIAVGNVVLFSQARGGVVRDFSYDFASDGFTGADLTVLARHLFVGKSIKAWAYAQAPDSIVWVVLDDGSLVSLTYMREHEVWAWTRHETDGTFEDVAVIPEGDEDVPYFIVNRTINSQTKRYIEKLHTREFADATECFFVDSGLTYDGDAVTSIRGLYHLEGKTVSVLADGNVVSGLTVTGGAITLPNEASVVHAGLPYEALMKTLDIDIGAVKGIGTVQGRYKSVGEITMRVQDTRGIFVGPREDRLTEWKQRQGEAWGEAIGLYTGDISLTPTGDWTRGGTMFIKQADPLPMTILALMPDLALGG